MFLGGCLLFVAVLLFVEKCCRVCVLGVWRVLFAARVCASFALVSWRLMCLLFGVCRCVCIVVARGLLFVGCCS